MHRLGRILKWIILLFCSSNAVAQDTLVTISGVLVYEQEGNAPLSDARVIVPQLRLLQAADAAGHFELKDIPHGTYTLIIQTGDEPLDSIKVNAQQAYTDLGIIHIRPSLPDLPISAAPAEEQSTLSNDDGVSISGGTSILLQASNRDPFLSTTGFVWGAYGFRNRGYYKNSPRLLINGIPMNDPGTGSLLWSAWGGLNDAFREVQSTYGLAASEHSFGNIIGTTAYTIAPQNQGKQTRYSYALSNRSYDHRIMLHHYTGVSRKGWAAGLTASMRRAEQSYRPGISFRSYSLLMSLHKQINQHHESGLTAFMVPSVKSKYSAVTDEVYELSGDPYYNPNWGWQNGEQRNAKEQHTFVPTAILHYGYHPSQQTHLRTSIAISAGMIRNTSLDWYKASDPRPDYYRNLPGYYSSTAAATAAAIKAAIKNTPGMLQLNWDRLYTVNRNNPETLLNANGIAGSSYYGNRSLYVLAADVERIRNITLNTTLQKKCSPVTTVYAGIAHQQQRTVYYRELADLLGGDYFLNYNMFAEQQYIANPDLAQNDRLHPDRIIRTGDHYRYFYSNQVRNTSCWLQPEFNFRKVYLFAAAQAALRQYQREGFYRNGLFPDQSEGKSALLSYLNYSVKGGVTFKINGRNYLFANGSYNQEDPGANALFISPRTRNQTVASVRPQLITSMEGGYLMKAPELNIRMVGYATGINGATEIQRFYNDEPEFQGFVNFVMTEVNTRYTGMELAIAYTVSPFLTVDAVASVGQAFYTNDPKVSIYQDNDTATAPAAKEVFLKNYYLGAGPQSAYATSINCTGKKFWYARLTFSYLDRNYIAVNPARRSREAAELTDPDDPVYHRIFDQEKLPALFTIDLSGGKSFRLNKLYSRIPYGFMLYLNVGVANLLNNKQMKTGGYEQLRYDFTNNNPDKFPNKYIYAPGRTFFINISIKQ